jgi:hypothetical protein
MRPWIAIVALSAAAGGCGGMKQVHISDAQLAQKASPGEQERVQTQEKRVTVAERDAATAHRGVEQAKDFRTMARRENEGALAQVDAATKARVFADNGHDANLRTLANEHERSTRKKLGATEALDSYANRLVTLRMAKADVADAETDLARADVQSLKAHIVSEGQPSDLSRRARQSRDLAVDRLRNARLRAQESQSQAQAARDLWLQRRSALTASRGTELPVFEPPATTRVPEAE